jgi:hypothetical protein
MKKSTVVFRLIIFNLIVLLPIIITFVSSYEDIKSESICLVIFIIILMGIIDVLIYIQNKINNINDKYGKN